MKKIIASVLLIVLTLPLVSKAQTATLKRNRSEVGLEAGGTGLYYDLFYQQNLFNIGNNKTLNLRIGGGVFPLAKSFSGTRVGFTIHVMPTMLFFSGRHAWETGVALNLLDQTRYNVELLNQSGGTRKINEVERLLMLGPQGSYRYYFSNQRYFLRATILFHIPITYWDSYKNEYTGLPVVPWAGVSGGITF